MKYFLNSADLTEIEQALEMWDIEGVTTTLRHIHKTDRPFLTVVREIGEMFIGTNRVVTVPTNPHHHNDYRELVNDAHKLVDLNLNFVIALPATVHGLKACDILSEEGIRTYAALCYSPLQALQAMRMGATYVSSAATGDTPVDDIVTIKHRYHYETEVALSAVRDGQQIIAAAMAGVDIVTADYAIYEGAFTHPLTREDLTTLQGDWDQIDYKSSD